MTIFSKIIRGEIPCYKVAESEHFFAFLDINPMKMGHTLVVPKVETDYVFDLDDDLLGNMMIFSKQVAKAISAAIPCNRVGVAVLGMEVPHAHIHLIPIDRESDMNLSNPKLKFSAEDMSRIAARIATEFSK